MKVGTPFGEYPFVYRRTERRPGGEIAVVGTVAGIESTVVFDRDDALGAAKVLAVAAALALSIRALRRRRG